MLYSHSESKGAMNKSHSAFVYAHYYGKAFRESCLKIFFTMRGTDIDSDAMRCQIKEKLHSAVESESLSYTSGHRLFFYSVTAYDWKI